MPGSCPRRWGSTRLPGKSLVELCGKPLIQWVIEAAQRAAKLDQLLVATDDARIVEVVESLGVRAVMTREDHPSGTDRVAEAVAHTDADVVVNIQGDEPLLDPGLVDRLVEVMTTEDDWDMATAATAIAKTADIENPSVVKVVWGDKGRALYFSRSVIPHIREDVDRDAVTYFRHLGIYAYRREFLTRLVQSAPTALEKAERLEQLRALHLGAKSAVIEVEDEGMGVDTREDVQYVERLLKERG